MQDLELVKRLESFDDLDDNFPDVFFFHKLLVVLALTNPLEHVSVVCILHDNTTKKLVRYVTYHSDDEGSSKKACL